MCYAKKIVGFELDYLKGSIEKDLGPDFDGQFDCARFNCGGCDHELVDGGPTKRNLGFKTKFRFSKT